MLAKTKMALPTSRPYKNWILYQKKKLGHPHEILRKKLICSKKVTTLPDLTVPVCNCTFLKNKRIALMG